MTKIDTIQHEISSMPDSLVDEVLEFIRCLKHKENTLKNDFYLANESALKDWLTDEEDKAWQNVS